MENEKQAGLWGVTVDRVFNGIVTGITRSDEMIPETTGAA